MSSRSSPGCWRRAVAGAAGGALLGLLFGTILGGVSATTLDAVPGAGAGAGGGGGAAGLEGLAAQARAIGIGGLIGVGLGGALGACAGWLSVRFGEDEGEGGSDV